MSSKNNNRINIPQAREAMDRFKVLICSGGGIDGGRWYKMYPVRSVKYERNNRI